MMKASTSRDFVAATPAPYSGNSLAVMLQAAGIRSIPDQQVRAHQRTALRAARTRLGRLGPVTFRATRLLMYLSFLFPQDTDKPWVVRTCAVVASAVLGLVAVGDGFLTGWLLMLPVIAFGALLILISSVSHRTMGALSARWQLASIDSEQSSVRLPRRYRALADHALSAAPNSYARIEYLENDPFLTIIRRRWIFNEKARVAAWNTGDSILDNFAAG